MFQTNSLCHCPLCSLSPPIESRRKDSPVYHGVERWAGLLTVKVRVRFTLQTAWHVLSPSSPVYLGPRCTSVYLVPLICVPQTRVLLVMLLLVGAVSQHWTQIVHELCFSKARSCLSASNFNLCILNALSNMKMVKYDDPCCQKTPKSVSVSVNTIDKNDPL